MLRPGEGETLSLGAPFPSRIVVFTDGAQSQGAFSAGLQTLQPGVELAAVRHTARQITWFIHKGQGRAVLDGRTTTVVPGMVITVPGGVWHALRNTGTGLLQVLWISAPAGLEAWWRQIGTHQGPMDAAALHEAAARHGVELAGRSAAPIDTSFTDPRRVGPPSDLPGGLGSVGVEAVAPVPHSSPARAPGTGRGRRRHRRSRRNKPPAQQVGGGPVEPRAADTPAQLPQGPGPSAAPHEVPASPARPSAQGRTFTRRPLRPGASGGPPRIPRKPRDFPRPQSRGPVKEIYMSGRWVRVEHEGPVIAPGRSYPPRRRRPTPPARPAPSP